MIRASDLVGSVVRTESGEKLGHVHDLRAIFRGGAWRLVGLVIGGGGLRARLAPRYDEKGLSTGDLVAWEAVTGVDDGVVTVYDEVAVTIS